MPLDNIDAYHVAFMERRGTRSVLSYDRHFDQVPGIDRLVPH